MHGDDVCRALIDGGRSIRILMLTASGAVDERVEGLSLGADDYLPKPFAFAELVARLWTPISATSLRDKELLVRRRIGADVRSGAAANELNKHDGRSFTGWRRERAPAESLGL